MIRRRDGLAGTAAVLATCLLGSALLSRLLPLPADDPFRGTLVLLPVILGALREIHRWSTRLGGRPLGPAATAGELGALGALAVLILARSHLSLAGMDGVLAAGLALVLGCRVARQAVAFRPLLGERLPRRPSVFFFLLPATPGRPVLGFRFPAGRRRVVVVLLVPAG